MRLDQAVAARFPEISRRKARELIAARRVLVNDRPLAVASKEVRDSDRITIADELPELAILAETHEWVAVNKPSGIPTQPPRDRVQRSLEELLRIRFREIFVVHRIDTQTSGVVVFARTRKAAASLSALFASREVKKSYLAVAEGTIGDEAAVTTAIDGRDAQTLLIPMRALDGATLVEARIATGRTHQIRIHLQSIGHPVVGDRRYGSTARASRMLLHAWKIEHPQLGGELIAPPPADFPVL